MQSLRISAELAVVLGASGSRYMGSMAERLFPTWVEPMAATLTHERVAGPDWVF